MVHCFVPFCPFASPRHRYGAIRDRNEKVLFFQPPKNMGLWDEAMFNYWSRKLPRPGFTKQSHVCEKHFLDCDIIRYDEVYLKNGTVSRTKLDEPYLSLYAYPMIFPSAPAQPVRSSEEKKNKVQLKPSSFLVSSTKSPSLENVPNDSSSSEMSMQSTLNSSAPSSSSQVKQSEVPIKKRAIVVPSIESSSVENVLDDSNPSYASIKSTPASSIPARSCQSIKNKIPLKRSELMVPSIEPSSIENVPHDSVPSDASIKSTPASSIPARSCQSKKNKIPLKRSELPVSSIEPSSIENVPNDSVPSDASIKPTPASSALTRSCQGGKNKISPKQSPPVVCSAEPSSNENVPNDINSSGVSVESVPIRPVISIPRITDFSLISNPPDPSPSSSDTKIRRSSRQRKTTKYLVAKAPKRTDRSRVPKKSSVSEKSPVTDSMVLATSNAITSSVPPKDNTSLNSSSKQEQPYDHIMLMEDLQKIKIEWPEWCFSDFQQQSEELILIVHIDPTSGLLDKYIKVKKNDLSAEGFLFSTHPPLSFSAVTNIHSNADIHKLLKFMANVRVAFEK